MLCLLRGINEGICGFDSTAAGKPQGCLWCLGQPKLNTVIVNCEAT
jgi:hypothetical protein